MRFVVRNNTFETNSSSVHSFVFENPCAGRPAFFKWESADEASTVTSDDTTIKEGEKVLHLFSWLPDLIAEVERKAADGEENEYGLKFKLRDDDSVYTAFSEWEDDCMTASSPEGKAEVLIMFFAARTAIEEHLVDDASYGNLYSSRDDCIDGYSVNKHIAALHNRTYICREDIMDALERQARMRGYRIDYGMLGRDGLCEVRINADAEHAYDALHGAGCFSFRGSWYAHEAYCQYKRWFVDFDGAGVGEFVFSDKAFYAYTCEGDDVFGNLRQETGDDFAYEPTYYVSALAPQCENKSFLLAKHFSATYEHMG